MTEDILFNTHGVLTLARPVPVRIPVLTGSVAKDRLCFTFSKTSNLGFSFWHFHFLPGFLSW